MKHYAELDVSLDETSVCIVDEAGEYVAETKTASDLAALADYLQATGLSFGRVGFEACPCRNGAAAVLPRPAFPSSVSMSGGRKPPSPR